MVARTGWKSRNILLLRCVVPQPASLQKCGIFLGRATSHGFRDRSCPRPKAALNNSPSRGSASSWRQPSGDRATAAKGLHFDPLIRPKDRCNTKNINDLLIYRSRPANCISSSDPIERARQQLEPAPQSLGGAGMDYTETFWMACDST